MTEAEKKEIISKYLKDNIELLKKEDKVIELILPNKLVELPTYSNIQHTFDLRAYLENVLLDSGIDLLGYVKEIPAALFSHNNYIESITIPGNIEYIGAYAFHDCTNLEKVYIKDGVKYIRYNAFKNCTKLEYVTLPKTLVYVDSSAFLDVAPGCKFIYGGKVEDWHEVDKHSMSLKSVRGFSKGTEIVCTDGVVRVG